MMDYVINKKLHHYNWSQGGAHAKTYLNINKTLYDKLSKDYLFMRKVNGSTKIYNFTI